MLGRFILAGAMALALGAPSVSAGGPSVLPILLLAKECFKSHAVQVQCAIQMVKEGDRNTAITKQSTVYSGSGHSLQLGITYQDGNDNGSYTEQVGEDQLALTVQKGNNNSAFTYQEGEDQFSATVQLGDGHWAATSSIGEDSGTFVYQSN
jgi:hypothetical protein